MITPMSSPVIQGQVESGTPAIPTRIAAASASPAHTFFNVIRDLIAKAGYHNEADVLTALEAVARYERQVIAPGDLRQVTSEADRAPFEDVSQRKPPAQAVPSPVLAGAGAGAIDYMALARALAAVQQEQAAAAADAPVVPAQ